MTMAGLYETPIQFLEVTMTECDECNGQGWYWKEVVRHISTAVPIMPPLEPQPVLQAKILCLHCGWARSHLR